MKTIKLVNRNQVVKLSHTGRRGLAGTITVGTVTTGAPDQGATVTNVGTSSEAILNFVIPQGFPATNIIQSVQGRTGDVVITKEDLNIQNIDNTSDANKPVSTAQQTELDKKVDKVAGKALSTNDYTTPEKSKLAGIATGATANDSNAQLRDRTTHTGMQPISSVTDLQDTLNSKANTNHTHTAASVTDFDIEVSNNTDVAANTAARHTHANKAILDAATASFTTADETKLDGIAAGAQVNTVTSVNTRTGAVTGLAEASDLTAHTGNTSNPHSVTKAQVGLGNVDNTSDVNKPVSTATQTALDGKADDLGADDNYVTDAEKTKLANLSGTNTGDQTLPTWSTIAGKPAVVAEGATQADARTAIGAGTSSLAIGTTAGTAAEGNDSRLTDARTPTAHVHAGADITTGTVAYARLPVGTTASTVAAGDDSRIGKIGGTVTVTGTPTAGQTVVASSGTDAAWGAPAGGGGGGVSLLQFWGVPAVTEFVPPAIIGGHVNFTCPSGYMYLCPLIVGETMNIDQAKVQVDTGVAGATLTLGLYKMVGGVMTRTNDFGTVSAATSGAKTISLTPFSLDPGFVYSALLVTGGSAVTVWGGGPAFGESMTSKGDPSAGTNWLGQWYSAGNATLPATMPHGVGTSVSNPSVPKVGLRRSA